MDDIQVGPIESNLAHTPLSYKTTVQQEKSVTFHSLHETLKGIEATKASAIADADKQAAEVHAVHDALNSSPEVQAAGGCPICAGTGDGQ